jgi:hypothetical protein
MAVEYLSGLTKSLSKNVTSPAVVVAEAWNAGSGRTHFRNMHTRLSAPEFHVARKTKS